MWKDQRDNILEREKKKKKAYDQRQKEKNPRQRLAGTQGMIKGDKWIILNTRLIYFLYGRQW